MSDKCPLCPDCNRTLGEMNSRLAALEDLARKRAPVATRVPPPLRTMVAGGVATTETREDRIAEEIEHALNRHSRENVSGTPDFILSELLMGCLGVYEKAIQRREDWHGRPINTCAHVAPGSPPAAPPVRQGEEPPRGAHDATCAGLKRTDRNNACNCIVGRVVPSLTTTQPPPPVNGGPLVEAAARIATGMGLAKPGSVVTESHVTREHPVDPPGEREPDCYLCETGFPLQDGVDHIGTQRLGMIPTTRCRKVPPEQPAEPSARLTQEQVNEIAAEVRADFREAVRETEEMAARLNARSEQRAAEPSAPPGFRVVGRSGPRVTAKGKMVKEARLMSGAQAPARWAAAVCPSEYPGDGGAWNAGCYDILEPIVEPPAPPPAEPAKGTLSDLLRSLYGGTLSGRKFAEQARDLETRLATAEQCWAAALESETAWTVRARDLETKLATAKKERDNAWEESRKLRDHIATRDARIKDLEDSAAALGARAIAAEHDEKVIRQRERLAERERCLEIVETYEPRRECPADWSYQGALSVVAARIGEGK